MDIQQQTFLQVALTGMESRYAAGGSDTRSDEQVCSTFKNIIGYNLLLQNFKHMHKPRVTMATQVRIKNVICDAYE